jgi:solute carrier family 25 phosphate transporter 3
MGKQVSFDFFAGQLYQFSTRLSIEKEVLKWLISISSAFLSSIIACLSSQPGDMILTATYNKHESHQPQQQQQTLQNTEQLKNLNIFQIVANIYKKHGLQGFYIGTSARLAHVASIITTQLVLYDIIKLALGLKVTGSH